MSNKKIIFTRIFCFVLYLTLFLSNVACSSPQDTDELVSQGVSSSTDLQSESITEASEGKESSELPESEPPTEDSDAQQVVPLVLQELAKLADEKKNLNPDVVGWLRIPDTSIDRAVLSKADDNSYYLKHDEDDNESRAGALSADYRNEYGDGTAAAVGKLTSIYGNTNYTSEENFQIEPDSPFKDLRNFLEEDFAVKHPYIFFSTTKEDMVWQVFAFSAMNVEIPYNRNNTTDEERMNAIDGALKASAYQYDTSVSASDQILVLSTNIYEADMPLYKLTGAEGRGYYRMVLFAKRIDNAEENAQADLKINPEVLLG